MSAYTASSSSALLAASAALASNNAQEVLERCTAAAASSVPLPRLLLVLAHADDEVLAMGARLERLAQSRLLTVTDGAPRDGNDARHHGFASLEAYRTARQEELRRALAHAGLSMEITQPIADLPPIPVPDQTAALHLAALTQVVANTLLAFRPDAVLTHPYEGGHPDHDACAFAVHTALRWRSAEGTMLAGGTPPLILESPFYHAGTGGEMKTGCFLDDSPGPQLIYPLTAVERANKSARLACFPSQAETLAQFALKHETYRIAPSYNFTEPPHPGQLLYERFGWGLTGERFRSLAAQAQIELFGEQNRGRRILERPHA